MTDFNPDHTLTAIVHGESGVGKTPSSLTVPAPALVLDVEGRTKFVQRPKVFWNPNLEEPPEPDGTWEICVVLARDWGTAKAALEWVVTGEHKFRSVVVDSVTELQKRSKDKLAGSDAVLSERLWGQLLTEMETYLRALRDATTHPTAPVQCVIFTAITDERSGKWSPHVQGALAKTLPSLVDVMGYLWRDEEDEDQGKGAARMLIAPRSEIRAKDATSELPGGGITGHFGQVVSGPIDWTNIIETIYQGE